MGLPQDDWLHYLGEQTDSCSGMCEDRIFLDSDDVSKLDAIIDVCACDCENVVVIMMLWPQDARPTSITGFDDLFSPSYGIG